MFKKLFSGDKIGKEQQTKAVPSQIQLKSQQQEMEFERTSNNLNTQIANLEQQQEQIETKFEMMDQQIRQLLQDKKKKQARTKIVQAKGYQHQIEKLETQKNVFIKMKIRLETAQTNLTSFDVIADVNQFLKNHEQLNDQLQEEMSQYQDISQSIQEQDKIWKQLQDIETQDMGDLDEELKRYEQEIEQGQTHQANKMSNIPYTNIQKQQQPQQSTKMNLLIN